VTVLGEAEVRIKPNTRGFAEQVEDDVESPLVGAAKKAAIAFAAIGGARKVASFFRDTIDAAADLGEEVSKNETVFGDASETVTSFAKNAASAFGQSESAALGAAGTYGNLFRSLELTEEKSAEMATTLTGLASDLASFNNTEVADAVDALRAGIVGETEPLKRFGININAATIEAEALALGLAETKDEIDAGVKAQATYSIIMRQTTLAQGDFARTSDGLANQQRALTAEWQNAKTEIGEGLLPVALMFVEMLRGDTIPAVTELAQAAVPLLIQGFETAAPIIGTTTDLLVALSPALEAIASVIESIPDPLIEAAAYGYAGSKAFGFLGSSLGSAAEMATGLVKVDFSGPLDGGARSAGKMTGGLRSLTKGMSGATAAAGLGVAAFSIWSNTVEEGNRRAKEFGEGIRTDIADQISASEDPLVTLEEKLIAVRDAQRGFEQDISGSSAPWDADFRRELKAGVAELEATDEQLVTMRDTASALGRQFGLTTEEALELALAQGIDLASGVDDSREAFEGAITEQREMERALGAVAGASEKTADEIKEQTDALHALTDATLGSFSSQLDYEDSLLDSSDALAEVREAEKALNDARGPAGAQEIRKAELELAAARAHLTEVQKDGEATELDLIAAHEGIRDAQEAVDEANATGGEAYRELETTLRDAERAALDQAEAALRVAEEAANAEGRTLSWKEKNTILRTELDRVRQTMEPGSPMFESLTGLIGKLDEVPGTYEARVAIDTAVAQGNLDRLARSLNDIFRAENRNIRISEGGGGGLILGSAHGFSGRIHSPTQFLVGEGGEPEDVLVVPTSLGGIDRVVAEMARTLGDVGAAAAGGAAGPLVGQLVIPGARRDDAYSVGMEVVRQLYSLQVRIVSSA
jgi:hypothetical protein